MPINNITQTISTISPPPHRGVDVQTVFVNKQEDFQDHLADITITELNTFKDQLNTRIGEINSTVTTMNGYVNDAFMGSSTATTKAGEASTSATAALNSKNQASTSATSALNSATKANQWADNNYNVAVEAGKYSAKHWSTVAQNATVNKVDKVTSTDNAIVRFDGITGAVQNSSVIIDDNENLNITGTGKIITGDFSNTTDGNRLSFETSTLNSFTVVNSFPNGTGILSSFRAFNTAKGLNSSFTEVYCDQTQSMIRAGRSGTGTYLPMTFIVNGAERMRIDTNGNVLVTGTGGLGYGAGSGGTVTQLTSKNTAVTLNKPCGLITMNNAALAAGASVNFQFSNSLLSGTDNLILELGVGISGWNNYRTECAGVVNETTRMVRLTNISGVSLAESQVLIFKIIKGVV